jgi:hypothetical protein
LIFVSREPGRLLESALRAASLPERLARRSGAPEGRRDIGSFDFHGGEQPAQVALEATAGGNETGVASSGLSLDLVGELGEPG